MNPETVRNITFVPWNFTSDMPSEDFVRMRLKLDIMDIGVRYKGFLMNNLEGMKTANQISALD